MPFFEVEPDLVLYDAHQKPFRFVKDDSLVLIIFHPCSPSLQDVSQLFGVILRAKFAGNFLQGAYIPVPSLERCAHWI